MWGLTEDNPLIQVRKCCWKSKGITSYVSYSTLVQEMVKNIQNLA